MKNRPMRFISGLFAFLLVSISYFAPCSLRAQSECTLLDKELPLRSTLASAGFFANLRNADHSINYLMDELLVQAHSAAENRINLERNCTRPCKNPILAIIFDSAPNLTLRDYDEFDFCQKMLEQTKREPLVYGQRSFSSDKEAKDWYHELTQGDGTDGEDLYTRCPGMCSPSYSSLAYKHEEKFMVSTTIICGHARDKDDDQYRLSSSLKWICPEKPV